MAEESIPVDLLNPGQVFACLGFLEAADVLLGQAEGGFDWTDEADVRFRLRARGDENPFLAVLRFVAEPQLERLAPPGYVDPPPSKGATKKKGKKAADDEADEDVTSDGALFVSETFPGPEADWRALPVRLERDGRYLDVSHWCDASSRNDFKLFAGQQRGPAIARAMINGIADLWEKRAPDLVRDPFGVTTPMGGSSFKFDARKSWTAIDAGYSPDEQKHLVTASPVVEILAAVGLEHARPDEFDTREVRYGAWSGLVRPVLARPALAGVHTGIPRRVFRFTLDLSGKNKVVTFAEEEANS
ncbi:MAG: type I-U CRISPR-associated protein Cas8c [Acidobacteria bacterium]|nr:type I-U CRISPR-associated protein Cas8c [Acidobacteriota bacterium]